jgi:hypothetical protein
MKTINLIFVLIIFGLVTSFKSKKKLFEGTIKYTIDHHTNEAKYPQELIVHIKEDIIRVDVALPSLQLTHIIDCKKKTYLKLCKVEGNTYYARGRLRIVKSEEPLVMVKDSIQTINDHVCSFGRINNGNKHYTFYSTSKYYISKQITECGAELPYHLFHPHKSFTSKLIMKQDSYDETGETTYLVEIISELPINTLDISPPLVDYKEVNEESLYKIIKDHILASSK